MILWLLKFVLGFLRIYQIKVLRSKYGLFLRIWHFEFPSPYFLLMIITLKWLILVCHHHLKMTWQMKIYHVNHHHFTPSHTWPLLHIICMNFWNVILYLSHEWLWQQVNKICIYKQKIVSSLSSSIRPIASDFSIFHFQLSILEIH